MEFGILGPLEVRGDAGPVEIRGAKRRGLVALLLVHAGQRVSMDRIVDALWDVEAAPGSPRTVQTYVSQLRQMLDGPGIGLVAREGGYALEIPADALDAARFERRVREADSVASPAERMTALDDALALWRGEPLEEFADAAWARPERARLELVRLQALERRVDAGLALGRNRDMIGDLEALVAEFPLDERLWALLMVAYYRSGRQADALRAFQRVRTRLADELGIDPGAELAQLEQRILDHDETLAASPFETERTAPAESRPEGVVTFVMTDIEDSTSLWDVAPQAMAAALERHEELVDEVVRSHHGRLVKSRGEGDATLSVFARASHAAAAAVDLQRALAIEHWPESLSIATRIALHTGEAHLRGGDYYGGTLNRAARIRGLAAGGQILCSRATADLVADVLPAEVTLEVAGTRELRGLRRPETVYALLHPEIPTVSVTASQVHAGTPGTTERRLPRPLDQTEQVRFVGRAQEIEQLWRAWTQVSDGKRRLVLVSGEPGVGKTRLAAEVARRAYDDGATVLFGRCDEDLGVPYQPFVEALHTYVGTCAPDDLARRIGPYGGDLARLLPELRERLPGLPPPLRADPQTERFRLLETVRTFVDAIAASGAPVMLVLDDLHWAAKPTLLLLRHLARSDADAAVFIVGTYRDTELDRRHPLAEMLGDLRRDEVGERVVLRGLDQAEVTEFVEVAASQLRGPEMVELARAIHAETEGNPFFVGQVLRHLVEAGAIERQEGRWVPTVDIERMGIPEGVREVIGRRLATLDDNANGVLATAAVAGHDFDSELLAEASGVNVDRVLDALDAAEVARLIEATDGQARFRFVHALVRSTLYDEIPTTRRLRLHRRIAQVLEPQAIDDERLLPDLARHYGEAAALGETAKAIHYAIEAGRRALGRLAYEEAARLYERALSVLEVGTVEDREYRGDLLIALAQARWAAGDLARARQSAYEAADEGRRVGRPELLARAIIGTGGKSAWAATGLRFDEAWIGLCEDALELLPKVDSEERAKVTARLATGLYAAADQRARRQALMDDAVTIARRLGDPATLAYVLSAAHGSMWEPGNPRERLAIAKEVLELGRIAGDRELEFYGAAWAEWDLLELGETEHADDMLAIEQALADELQQPQYRYQASLHRTTRALMDGCYEDVARLADEIAASGIYGGPGGDEGVVPLALGIVHFELGRARGGLEHLESLLRDLVRDAPGPVRIALRCGLAYLYALLERPDEVRAELDDLAANDFLDFPTDVNWMSSIATLTVACAFIGDAELSARLYELLLPFREYSIYPGNAIFIGSAELFLALAAGTAARWERADDHFARAMLTNARTGCRSWLVHGRYEYAALLSRRGDPDDAPRLRELLHDCLTGATEMGMTRVVAQARALAERCGIQLPGSGTRS